MKLVLASFVLASSVSFASSQAQKLTPSAARPLPSEPASLGFVRGPCHGAKTVLRIAGSQMMKGTEKIILTHLDFLPLKTNAHIVEGNALRIDWEDVVPKDRLSYIMENARDISGLNA